MVFKDNLEDEAQGLAGMAAEVIAVVVVAVAVAAEVAGVSEMWWWL